MDTRGPIAVTRPAVVVCLLMSVTPLATSFAQQPTPVLKAETRSTELEKKEKQRHLRRYKVFVRQQQWFEANQELRALPRKSAEFREARKFYQDFKKELAKDQHQENSESPSTPAHGGGTYVLEGNCTCWYVKGSTPPTSCSDPRCKPFPTR